MPELPEVENVRRKLQDLIVGKTIQHVKALIPRMVNPLSVEEFEQTIKNKTIINMNRKGKYLIFELDQNYVLVSHLRMEGKYHYYTEETPLSKHDHVIFTFTDGTELCYNDVRKFGTFDLVLKDQIESIKGVRTLGIEPQEGELKAEYLLEKLKGKTKPIKNALLDQTIIAGLGNIYVDEVLFYAGVMPTRTSKSITPKEAKGICEGSEVIIQKAIEKGGSTIRSYNSLGEQGEMQDFHNVYDKKGQPCPTCQTTIEKMKVSGRGTHYCPKCQT